MMQVYLTACAGSDAAARAMERIKLSGTVRNPYERVGHGYAAVCGAAGREGMIDECEALVAIATDNEAASAEVFYALHKRRIPALCLAPHGSNIPMLTDNDHPLLTYAEYSTLAEAEALIDSFLAPPSEPGRIFVVEGGDGAGKQTQSAMLRERLAREGYPVKTMDFPQDGAMHGKLIRTLLSGAMGDISQVNPLLFASLYAQNRYDVSPILLHWIRRGNNVILDRYVEANYGHQASKLPPAERPALIDALSTFEHEWLGVPRAHRVVYLDLPPREALRALANDSTRAALDMHETAGADYKEAVRDTFVYCSERNTEVWHRIMCVTEDGTRVTKEKLGETLYQKLADEFVNKGA